MKCLLDIDGVILPFGGPNMRCDGQDICIPGHMNDLIRVLDREFEIVWASMWEENSNEIGRILGLDKKEFIPMPRRVPEGNVTFKLEAVKAWDPGGGIVWIDDDLGPDAYEWGRAREAVLLAPSPEVGLTAGQVEKLTGSRV